MIKKAFIISMVLFSAITQAGYEETPKGSIARMGAMTVSSGWSSWITLQGVSTLSSCRKAPEFGGLVLFRIKREAGEREIYSTALTAYTTNKKVILLINPYDVDKQGNCFINAIWFAE